MPANIPEIKARYEAATEGPWLTPKEAGDPYKVKGVDHEGQDVWPWAREEDMVFAYKARSDIPQLVAALEEAEARLRLEQASFRDCDRFLVAASRERDRYKARAERRKEALEHTIRIFGDHVGSCSSYLCREDCPHHGDARPWSSTEEHDNVWTKPCDCVMKPIRAAIEEKP